MDATRRDYFSLLIYVPVSPLSCRRDFHPPKLFFTASRDVRLQTVAAGRTAWRLPAMRRSPGHHLSAVGGRGPRNLRWLHTLSSGRWHGAERVRFHHGSSQLPFSPTSSPATGRAGASSTRPVLGCRVWQRQYSPRL